MSADFIESLITSNLAGIRSVPKTDIHCHALFSAKRKHVETRIGRALPKPPPKMDGLDGMMAYAEAVLMPHIRHREGFEFVAVSAINDAVQDGVVLLEMSFDIRLTAFYPNGLTGLSTFLKTLVERYQPQVTLRPELGVARESVGDPQWVAAAHAAVDSGVFQSIDLYGREDPCPPESMEPLFTKAGAAGMKRKAHIGEFGGATDIQRTVEVLELDEVQHGIGAVESVDVMRWLSENRIQLNVCPTSNVSLGGVQELSVHPIRILFDNGVPVTINTDDLMIFDQTVSEEYQSLYHAGVFSAAELDSIRRASLAE